MQHRQALLVSAACVVATLPLLMPSAHADDPLKNKAHQVHKHAQSVKGDLDESSKALRTAQAGLSAARAKLSAAQATLASTRSQLGVAKALDARMQTRLAKAQQVLAAAQAAVTQSKVELVAQRRQIGVLAAQNYQYGDPQLMGLVAVLGGGTPTDITSQLNTVHSLMSREATTLDTLRVEEAQLVVEERKVADARNRVATQRAAAATNLERKQQLEDRASTERAKVAQLVATRKQAKARATQIRARDLKELKALQRQEARIKQQILARSRHQKNRTVANTSGLLYRPVPGYVTSPYGWRIHPIYGYWGLHDGDDFHAPCGTPERAADNGTVISEYYSSVWGNRLYLDLGKINGHNFTVIYNHIERYAARTGERVARGQVVAYAGTTGWSTGCHLHFTVMRDGVAVNPMDYM